MSSSHYDSLGRRLKSLGLSGQSTWLYGSLGDLVLAEMRNLLRRTNKHGGSGAKLLDLGAGTCAFAHRLSDVLGLE